MLTREQCRCAKINAYRKDGGDTVDVSGATICFVRYVIRREMMEMREYYRRKSALIYMNLSITFENWPLNYQKNLENKVEIYL